MLGLRQTYSTSDFLLHRVKTILGIGVVAGGEASANHSGSDGVVSECTARITFPDGGWRSLADVRSPASLSLSLSIGSVVIFLLSDGLLMDFIALIFGT